MMWFTKDFSFTAWPKIGCHKKITRLKTLRHDIFMVEELSTCCIFTFLQTDPCSVPSLYFNIVVIIVIVTMKVVKHTYKLIPMKNWDFRNMLGKSGRSLDTTNNLIFQTIE